MQNRRLLVASALGGLFGALSSLFSKLLINALSIDYTRRNMQYLLYKLFLIAGIIISNIFVWYCFALSQAASANSSTATTLNTACNFLVSALLGQLVLNEGLSAKWLIGASMIVLGSYLLLASEERKVELKLE